MRRDYVWTLRVDYPAEAMQDHPLFGEMLDPDWRPAGWEPSDEYVNQFGTEDFVWPKVRRFYLSRSTAVSRAVLLERFGATVRLLRSQPLEFEERDFKRPRTSLRVVRGGAA
ncbi:hypothetical protein SEA_LITNINMCQUEEN_54 [Gordonia phage LitninMcQueen]